MASCTSSMPASLPASRTITTLPCLASLLPSTSIRLGAEPLCRDFAKANQKLLLAGDFGVVEPNGVVAIDANDHVVLVALEVGDRSRPDEATFCGSGEGMLIEE